MLVSHVRDACRNGLRTVNAKHDTIQVKYTNTDWSVLHGTGHEQVPLHEPGRGAGMYAFDRDVIFGSRRR